MEARGGEPRRPQPMDPDCAVCHSPASAACECEAKALTKALRRAEHRVMSAIYDDIRFVARPPSHRASAPPDGLANRAVTGRAWVRQRAQDHVLDYFRELSERRKNDHSSKLDHLTAQAFYQYHAAPHPRDLRDLEVALKRGIDLDWQASLQRYPEVLDYYFSLVQLRLPRDSDPALLGPLGAHGGHGDRGSGSGRKPSRRAGGAVALVADHGHPRGPDFARVTPAPRWAY